VGQAILPPELAFESIETNFSLAGTTHFLISTLFVCSLAHDGGRPSFLALDILTHILVCVHKIAMC
jgi:hypothetical protein